MIVVTGATGELGRAVVENLLHDVPAEQVAVACVGRGPIHPGDGRGCWPLPGGSSRFQS